VEHGEKTTFIPSETEWSPSFYSELQWQQR